MFIHPFKFQNRLNEIVFDLASNWELENSQLVNQTYHFCDVFKDNHDKIECVINQIGKRYNYNVTRMLSSELDNITDPILLFSDDIPKQGYVCRDIAITYDAIFRKMGFITDYQWPPNHVFNTVYSAEENNSVDCQVNMDRFFCWW